MSLRRLTLPIPDEDPAMLTLPEALTLGAIGRLELAIGDALRGLRNDLRAAGVVDPASIEVDSWSIHLHRET